MDAKEMQAPEQDLTPATEGAPQTDSEKAEIANQSDTNHLQTGQNTAPAAGKRRLPQLPKNVHFVTIDEKAGVETEADKEKNELLDMMESLKNGRILTDHVQGMERPDFGGEPVAVVYHGSFKVMIPASQLMDPPEDTRGHPLSSLMAYMVTKRFGSQIDYVIKGIDSESGVAVASRKDAMAIKRRQFYFTPDRDGNNRLYEGCLAEARVVAVLPSRVYIELFGAETYVGYKELSYQRIPDANTLYAPGDRVLTKILSIDRQDRNEVKVTASIKQAQENPLVKALKKYSIGNYYSGVVSMVDVLGVFVTLDGGGECLCGFSQRGRPFPGARATVRIRDIDLEHNRMWGEILYWNMP